MKASVLLLFGSPMADSIAAACFVAVKKELKKEAYKDLRPHLTVYPPVYSEEEKKLVMEIAYEGSEDGFKDAQGLVGSWVGGGRLTSFIKSKAYRWLLDMRVVKHE